ncbi:MAG TPA: outer membrane beta-barrel protein [Planctomycetota bacterium]|nr:outer membrane beta-barrel protein [Planctomycetota bacterium]
MQGGAAYDTTPAGSGLRLRLTGGFVTTKDSNGPSGEDTDFDEGYLLSIGIGERLGHITSTVGIGLELEGVFTDQDASTTGGLQAVNDLTVAGALLNAVIDIPIAERFAIYGVAGAGAAWLDSDTAGNFEEDDGPFLAWQLKAGVEWRFATSTSLHFGYRFLNVDDAEIDDDVNNVSFDLETRQHVLEAGLIFGV